MITQKQFKRFHALIDRENCSASRGLITQKVEQQLSTFFNGQQALFVSSGTAALHLCLKSLGVGCGDEVIVPNFTFSATALAVKHCGANPVFATVDLPSGWINLRSIERLVNERTKAIVPVHLNGYIGDMTSLMEFAYRRQLFVIEDACQAFGSYHHGCLAGTIGTAGCFSFNSSKHIPAGEGGLIVSRDDRIINACRRMMRFGDTGLKALSYNTQCVGWNYKAPEIVAALVAAQLPDIDEILKFNRSVWQSWWHWCHSQPFDLPYDLTNESPWRICLVPENNDSHQNDSFLTKSGRWCRKPISDQTFFRKEKYDAKEIDALRDFMNKLIWLNMTCPL